MSRSGWRNQQHQAGHRAVSSTGRCVDDVGITLRPQCLLAFVALVQCIESLDVWRSSVAPLNLVDTSVVSFKQNRQPDVSRIGSSMQTLPSKTNRTLDVHAHVPKSKKYCGS